MTTPTQSSLELRCNIIRQVLRLLSKQKNAFKSCNFLSSIVDGDSHLYVYVINLKRKTQGNFSLPMFSFKLLICLFLLLFQILRTYFLKLLFFIKFGRLVFFMILCHSHLTFSIQLIFPHFGSPTFPAFKEIYSTNIVYLILLM